MKILASSETDRNLHFVACAQEFSRVPDLGLKIVGVDVRSKANFLELSLLLLFAGLPLFAALLITEFPVVHQTSYGWVGIRRNLDEIKSLVSRRLERFHRGNYSELIAFFIDQAYFSNADAFVDAHRSGAY